MAEMLVFFARVVPMRSEPIGIPTSLLRRDSVDSVYALVAQWIEQSRPKGEVAGSTPA